MNTGTPPREVQRVVRRDLQSHFGLPSERFQYLLYGRFVTCRVLGMHEDEYRRLFAVGSCIQLDHGRAAIVTIPHFITDRTGSSLLSVGQ